MIEQEKIRRMIKRINEWSYEGDTPFTVLPPSYGEKYLLRVYGCGGLLARIRYDYFTKRTKDIYLMDEKYCEYLSEESSKLKNYLILAKDDSDYAVKLFGGDEDCEINKEFLVLAAKAMKNRWIKTTELPKEKNIQASIVANFMRNSTNWKVIAQEVQFEKEWFVGGDYSEDTSTTERFDLIVMSEKGLGFVELKVNNENYSNLNSHYEHMQFVRTHPQMFVEEIDKRFQLIKKYDLWQENETMTYDNKKIWFGFLFVNGGHKQCKAIVKTFFEQKHHNSDDTYYMYYEGDIKKMDINNMMNYDDFIAYESN